MNIFQRKYQSAFSLFLTILMLSSWVMSSGLCPSMLQNSISDATTDCCPSNTSNHETPTYSSPLNSCDCCGCGIMQDSSESSIEIAVVGSQHIFDEIAFLPGYTFEVDFNTSEPDYISSPNFKAFSPPIHLLNQVFLN